jgi:hypothetical protein
MTTLGKFIRQRRTEQGLTYFGMLTSRCCEMWLSMPCNCRCSQSFYRFWWVRRR